MKSYSETMFNAKWLTPKQLVVGREYKFFDNTTKIYMGKHFEYYNGNKSNKSSTKKFFFSELDKNGKLTNNLFTRGTITRKIANEVDDKKSKLYPKAFDLMEGDYNYSPIDPDKDKFHFYTAEEISKNFNKLKDPSCVRFEKYADYPNCSGYDWVKLSKKKNGVIEVKETTHKYGLFSTTSQHNVTPLEDYIKEHKPYRLTRFLETGHEYVESWSGEKRGEIFIT